MNQGKLTAFALIFICLGALFTIRFFIKKQRATDLITIGILQTASHPALDAVREGFEQTISKLTNNKVQFVIRNGQGSLSNLHAMAVSLHADQTIHGFLAIATPAAQALTSVEQEKPIFIAAVSNPDSVVDLKTHTNISGSSDRIDTQKGIALLRALVPTAQHVAVFFSPAEKNSSYLAQKIIDELTQQNITPIKIGITNEADVIPAVENAIRKADAIIAPTDNIIASSIRVIADRALNARKPLIVSDNLLVCHGPLAAQGVDYRENGSQAAAIAYDVLINQKKISDIPIAYPINVTVYINRQTADALKIVIPETVRTEATFVDTTTGACS